MSETRVLVTGATGFIAAHCIRELVTHGYAVRATVRDLATADVAHLREFAGDRLDLVEARLDADPGWAAAVDGCTYVWHLASPNPPRVPRDEDDVVGPAVDGTLRVLRAAAASGTVRRVVLTSSTDAITHGHDDQRVRTEADWSVVDRCPPYPKSKVRAERAAWDFVRDHDHLELVTVNPGLVLGPLSHAQKTTSLEAVRMLLSRRMPAVPHISVAVVDVRDVAVAHRLATEVPGAAGNRYICTGEHMWLGDIASVLAAEYGPRGYAVPTRRLPYWLMWTIARVDPTARLALNYVGVPMLVDAGRTRKDLGWTPRPARESIVDAAESLLRYGLVRRSGADKRSVRA